MVKQTAGRNQLGEFAPKFAELNDDVLFGEVWSREDKLSLRDRSLITVVALMSKGILDSSLKSHLINAKKNGITKEEMAEIITHAAESFNQCKEKWNYERRNGRNYYSCRFLCWMAKCLGNIPYGKRSI